MSALNTVRVLELSEGVAGEYCGKLLSDFGADVIKLEKPGVGSPTRRLGPFKANATQGENSGLFAYLNTNKHSVALDLTTQEGAHVLGQLLDRVDVVIDDHAPEELKRLGVDVVSAADATSATRRVCDHTVRSIGAGGSTPCRGSQRCSLERLGLSHAERVG